ncbi:hypothetical protein DENSPDRAFT_344470 [Dentipellis sp. KUC8613]|nr:hypothetical protein DENSPDRAFT_344470 [Dentipellis sp. KUC8613]
MQTCPGPSPNAIAARTSERVFFTLRLQASGVTLLPAKAGQAFRSQGPSSRFSFDLLFVYPEDSISPPSWHSIARPPLVPAIILCLTICVRKLLCPSDPNTCIAPPTNHIYDPMQGNRRVYRQNPRIYAFRSDDCNYSGTFHRNPKSHSLPSAYIRITHRLCVASARAWYLVQAHMRAQGSVVGSWIAFYLGRRHCLRAKPPGLDRVFAFPPSSPSPSHSFPFVLLSPIGWRLALVSVVHAVIASHTSSPILLSLRAKVCLTQTQAFHVLLPTSSNQDSMQVGAPRREFVGGMHTQLQRYVSSKPNFKAIAFCVCTDCTPRLGSHAVSGSGICSGLSKGAALALYLRMLAFKPLREDRVFAFRCPRILFLKLLKGRRVALPLTCLSLNHLFRSRVLCGTPPAPYYSTCGQRPHRLGPEHPMSLSHLSTSSTKDSTRIGSGRHEFIGEMRTCTQDGRRAMLTIRDRLLKSTPRREIIGKFRAYMLSGGTALAVRSLETQL